MKEKMQFTFGLLLYNQQKFIIETLESIKFQIETYGTNVECDLILNDDCSTDHSLLYAKDWIQKNKHLFRTVVINQLKHNQGTVKGQQFIIDNCKTDYFKIIACDDLFSSMNIFNCYSLLNNKTIKTYLRLELLDGNLQINEEVLMKSFYLRQLNNHLLSMRQGCYLHSPSTIYKKDLYHNAKCNEFNSQFRLFEDDPTWYQMIKNTDDLSILFIDEVIVLYRVSNSSVSNSPLKDNPFSKELKHLSSLYELETNGLEQLYFKSRNSNAPNFLHYDKYIDFINKKKYKHYCIHSKEYSQLITKMQEITDIEQIHYNHIKRLADEFTKELYY